MTQRRSHLATVKIMGLVSVFVAFFLFHIWFRTQSTRLGFELSLARREMKLIEGEVASLKVQRMKAIGHRKLESLVLEWKAGGVEFAPARSDQLIYVGQGTGR